MSGAEINAEKTDTAPASGDWGDTTNIQVLSTERSGASR